MTGLKPVTKTSIAIAIFIALAVAGIGGSFTDLGPWYQVLNKPVWQPPGLAFPVIWTLIFGLTAASGAMAWRSVHSREDGLSLFILFGVNAALNLMWSYIFFAMHRPDWGLYQVGFFWLSILILIVYLWPRHRLASFLLFPYLIWVGIASFLNFEIVQLNGPFG